MTSKKEFFFVTLNVSVHKSLAISRHITVNMHAECKYYILNYAIKLHYFETGAIFEYQLAHTVELLFYRQKSKNIGDVVFQYLHQKQEAVQRSLQKTNMYGRSTGCDKSSFKSRNG